MTTSTLKDEPPVWTIGGVTRGSAVVGGTGDGGTTVETRDGGPTAGTEGAASAVALAASVAGTGTLRESRNDFSKIA